MPRWSAKQKGPAKKPRWVHLYLSRVIRVIFDLADHVGSYPDTIKPTARQDCHYGSLADIQKVQANVRFVSEGDVAL
jgi:hypothetical protein